MHLTPFRRRHHARESADVAAGRALGWVSLAIGLTELALPRKLEKTMGLDDGTGQNAGAIRMLGLRELAHGFDILSHRDPTPGVWGRVVGDLIDGVFLGLAARKSRNPAGMAAIFALVMPVVLADLVLAKRLDEDRRRRQRRWWW